MNAFRNARQWIAGAVLGVQVLSGRAEPPVRDAIEVAREFDQASWQHLHGLPANRIWAVLQSRAGYLWAGTQRGLARFDGMNFEVFDHLNVPEMPNDDCRWMVEERDGILWISTGQGVIRKSGDRFKRFQDDQGLFLKEPPALCASVKGGVWVGGRGWVGRITGDSVKTWVQDLNLPKNPMPAAVLDEDETGALWVGNQTGLFRFEPDRGEFTKVGGEPDVANRPVFGLGRSSGGKRWVGLADELPVVGRGSPRSQLATIELGAGGLPRLVGVAELGGLGRGSFVVSEGKSGVWLPSVQSGLLGYRDGRVELYPFQPSGKFCYAISACADREGNLWVGTENSGLYLWTRLRFAQYTAQDGLADGNLWTICEARDGSLWIGADAGVSRFKGGKFSFYTRPDGSAPKDVRSIVEDGQGTIWIGTIRSLEGVRNGQITSVRLPGEWFETKIRALRPARDGALWIGTVRGLTCWREGRPTKYGPAEGLPAEEVRDILEDRAGAIWVGTFGGGLCRFQAGQFTSWSTTNGLSDNNVWALHEDADGVLWVGTERGLNRLQNGHLTSFTRREGLPADVVNCVLEDHLGWLWVGYDRGIYAVEKRQLEAVMRGERKSVRVIEWDESDGLPSLEITAQKSNPAACKTRDGRLWFPTAKGLAVVNPACVDREPLCPRVVFQEVRANGQLVLGGLPIKENPGSAIRASTWYRNRPLRLAPGTAKVLEFRYTANVFVAPEKARFRYRLQGLTDDWIEVGHRREVSFTDLRPGAYQLEMVACDHHGVWQELATPFAFQVTPFFYQTSWFYLSCAAALLALAGLAVGWRLRELKRIHLLEQQNALNEQRRRIARDIHDELSASLTHIVQLSGETRKNLQQTEKVDRQARRIAAIAADAVDDIGEIVWANNPEFDTLEDLTAYLREYAASFFAETSVRVRFDFPATVAARPVSGWCRRHLVLLLKESLQNISKHAVANEVTIRFAPAENQLMLSIADDGRGFVPAAASTGNGMVNMRQRVQELGGALEITSAPGSGTTIRATIPLQTGRG